MKKYLLLILLPLFSATLTLSALADVPPDNAPFKLGTNTLTSGATDLFQILQHIVNWIFTILIILAVIMFLLAAFNYLTSAGNDEKIKKAHKMLVWAAVGLAVAFLAKGLIFIVKELVAPGAQYPQPGQL